MELLLAVGLALHGLIYLIGFVVGSRLAKIENFPYSTSSSAVESTCGDAGMRILGAVWLLLGAAFVAAGAGWRRGLIVDVVVLGVVVAGLVLGNG